MGCWTEITVPTYGIESTCTLVPYRVYRTMRRVVCILQYVHTKVCRMQDSVLSTGDAPRLGHTAHGKVVFAFLCAVYPPPPLLQQDAKRRA